MIARLALLGAAAMTIAADSPKSPAESAAGAAVDVGHVFGQGGTDGLILYALILGTFLMFLAAVIISWMLLRVLSAKERSCTSQNEKFADAVKDCGEALRLLAETQATRNATEVAHQAALTAMMARMEAALARVDPINGR